MVEKLTNEAVKRKDLELILEVNKKAIEIQSEVVEQNEDIIEALKDIKKTQEDHSKEIEKIAEKSEKTNRDIFKIQILFVTGLLSIVIQIVQIFISKK